MRVLALINSGDTDLYAIGMKDVKLDYTNMTKISFSIGLVHTYMFIFRREKIDYYE